MYEQARARHPHRWAAKVRNWQIQDAVYLNPEHDQRAEEKMPYRYTLTTSTCLEVAALVLVERVVMGVLIWQIDGHAGGYWLMQSRD